MDAESVKVAIRRGIVAASKKKKKMPVKEMGYPKVEKK